MAMMNGPMGGMMMLGCGILALFALAILVLGVVSLLKHLRIPG